MIPRFLRGRCMSVQAIERQVLGRMADLDKWEHRGARLWRADLDGTLWHYVLFSPDHQVWAAGPASGWHLRELPGVEDEIRRRLEKEIKHALLPECVAPGCTDKAPVEYVAAERGKLAGKQWEPGDKIRLCPEHGYDVFAAQGQDGDQLPDWLKADAKTSALDKFDADSDPFLPPGWLEKQARIMRVARKSGGRHEHS